MFRFIFIMPEVESGRRRSRKNFSCVNAHTHTHPEFHIPFTKFKRNHAYIDKERKICVCVCTKKGIFVINHAINWRSIFKIQNSMQNSDVFYHSPIHNNCSVSDVFVLHTILNCKWQISLKCLLSLSLSISSYSFCVISIHNYSQYERHLFWEICEFGKYDASNNNRNIAWRHMKDKVYYPQTVGIDIFYLCMYQYHSLSLCLWFNFNFNSYFLNAFHWRIKTLSLCIQLPEYTIIYYNVMADIKKIHHFTIPSSFELTCWFVSICI